MTTEDNDDVLQEDGQEDVSQQLLLANWAVYRMLNGLLTMKVDAEEQVCEMNYTSDVDRLVELYSRDMVHYHVYMSLSMMLERVGHEGGSLQRLRTFPSVSDVNKKGQGEVLARLGLAGLEDEVKPLVFEVFESAGIIKKLGVDKVVFHKPKYRLMRESIKGYAHSEHLMAGFMSVVAQGFALSLNELEGPEAIAQFAMEELEQVYALLEKENPRFFTRINEVKGKEVLEDIPNISLPYDLGDYHKLRSRKETQTQDPA